MTASPEMHGAEGILEVRGLTVDIDTDHGPLRAVDGVSIDVHKGEVLGVVGESGCGKSITALSLMRLLPRQAVITAGQCLLRETDLVKASERELRELRGRRMGMVFQDPLTSLNPLVPVGKQLIEALRLHQDGDKRALRERAAELLRLVRVPDPIGRMRCYPHELSGGMRQRVMIAMAVSNDPDLLIADEPTTALDVTTQAEVLDSLRLAREAAGSGLILITHDLGIIADETDRVAVMYNGRIVEQGATRDVLTSPRHPYTSALLGCRPTSRAGVIPVPIPGHPPRPGDPPTGCAFAPRCSRARTEGPCTTAAPSLQPVSPGIGHAAACHYADDADTAVPRPATSQPRRQSGDGLLSLHGLTKEFRTRAVRRGARIRAVDSIDLEVRAGETLALAGESGCGKSTTARLILRLIEPTSGETIFEGEDISQFSQSRLRAFRTRAQIVLQDPYSALDPRKTAGEAIAEPMRSHGLVTRAGERDRVDELLVSVGLFPEHARRFPHELSGGQRQRVCVARALGLNPRLLILDEAVSALDVSVQAQILTLLRDLQMRRSMTYLFITHDLAVVRAVADRVAIMYLGRIVEEGPVGEVFARPQHPYTRLLLSTVPGKAADAGSRVRGSGEPPDPANLPRGCAFSPRCQHAESACLTRAPLLADHGETSGHRVACHIPLLEDPVRSR
jgi:oligopeptide/dipeptide ABC transporter ATP-binding protein